MDQNLEEQVDLAVVVDILIAVGVEIFLQLAHLKEIMAALVVCHRNRPLEVGVEQVQ